MHFQIYIPEPAQKDPLPAVGLADLVTGASSMRLQQGQGPDGKAGLLLAWQTPQAPRMGWFPGEQTWRPAVPSGDLPAARYWVGTWNASPPKPSDLARAYQYVGHLHQLGDGNQWRFPNSRELPRDMILADDGSWRFEVQRQYHAWWLRCNDYIARLAEGESTRCTISYTDVLDLLVNALRLNYRLPIELVSDRKLFSTANVQRPVLSVCGLQLEGAGP